MQEALKKERDQAKMYLDTAGVMFVILDKEARVLLLNKKGYEILGYEEGNLLGKNWFDACLPVEARGNVRAVFDEMLIGNVKPIEYFENEVVAKDGKKRVLAFHNAVIRNDSNEIVGTFASGEDITERRAAENSLKVLNKELESRVKERTAQLESANVELEAFSYSVSHDLRAPLRAMDGFSKMLLEDHSESLDGEAKRMLDVIINNSRNMAMLIDDLLAFSRLSRENINISELNMEAIARSVFEEITALMPSRKIELTVKRLPGARGDERMIRQVFYNLIDNAVKFTKNRQAAEIEIGSLYEGNNASYYVKDNGAGFNPQYSSKLFGVFQRLHSTEEFEGTGVGLAIVERIIKKHGGRIRAESKPGEGAVFLFTLAS